MDLWLTATFQGPSPLDSDSIKWFPFSGVGVSQLVISSTLNTYETEQPGCLLAASKGLYYYSGLQRFETMVS